MIHNPTDIRHALAKAAEATRVCEHLTHAKRIGTMMERPIAPRGA
jgi:hypothetical protein